MTRSTTSAPNTRAAFPKTVAVTATATAAALLFAGCSSSTAGKGGTNSTAGGASTSSSAATTSAPATPTSSAPSSSASAPSSPASPSSSSAGGRASDPASLFRLLNAGVSTVHSLHIALSTTVATTAVNAAGNEQLSKGKLTGLDLTESVSGQSFRIINAGGKTYVHLPAALSHGITKPYALVSAHSSNATIRIFATSLGSTLSSSSLSNYSVLAQVASSVRVVGNTSVGGVPVTHYSIVVDLTKLPASYPNRAALQTSGLKSLPVELYVDAHGRPVEVTEDIAVSGQHVKVKLLVTKYNVPVRIAAPPASQVDTH